MYIPKLNFKICGGGGGLWLGGSIPGPMKEMTQSRVAYNKIASALQTCYTNGVAAIVLHYICLPTFIGNQLSRHI